jgi:hypothetical protein
MLIGIGKELMGLGALLKFESGHQIVHPHQAMSIVFYRPQAGKKHGLYMELRKAFAIQV